MPNSLSPAATCASSADFTHDSADSADASQTRPGAEPAGNLGVTALYTAATWSWGNLQNSSLFMHKDAARVFAVTNAALRVAKFFGSRSLSLPCGLVQRHAILDGALRRANAGQVIELAAGLSRRGATFSEDPGLDYTEVDQTAVLARKRQLLRRTPGGAAVLRRPNLRFIDQDVVAKPLDQLPVQEGTPLAVLAEGLFVYLDADQQSRVCAQVQQLIARAGSGTFLLDFVPWSEQPQPSLVGRLLDGLLRRVTRSSGFVRDSRTRYDIAAMLRTAGFRSVEMIEPKTAAPAWQVPFLDCATQQLVFVAVV